MPTFISGPYDWDIDGTSLGVLGAPPRLRFAYSGEEIRGDNLGATIQGVINLGGPVYIDMIFQEFTNAKAQLLFWPFDSDVGFQGTAADTEATYAGIGCQVPGKLLHAEASASSCATPKEYWFNNVIMAPNQDVSWPMGTTLRNVGVSLLVQGMISTVKPGRLEYFTNDDPAA